MTSRIAVAEIESTEACTGRLREYRKTFSYLAPAMNPGQPL